MPNKLTDTEIKKALAQCEIQTYCSDCPYYTKIGCKKHLYQDALDPINRQDQENESLKAEVERLKEEKSKFENKIEEIYPLVMQLPNVMQQAKAEAYKECIEKVKKLMEGWGDLEYYSDVIKAENDLDNLLKEFERKENIAYDD